MNLVTHMSQSTYLNHSNCVKETEGTIPDNPDTPNSTPQTYQSTSQGTVSVNSEKGDAEANFLALALDAADNFIACMVGAFF